MKPLYIFPGSFCPPTRGHVAIVEKSAEVFPEIIVVCSRNPQKEDNWFTEEECCALWQTYQLPDNVKITTFTEFAQKNPDPSSLVMIRGIRNETDFEAEKQVMFFNFNNFHINKFFHVIADKCLENISATKVRQTAQNLDFEKFKDLVSPGVVTALLEKVLQARNLFIVVGKPASGKSTFLKKMAELNFSNHHLNTDLYTESLKPMIAEKFRSEDLIKLTSENLQAVKELIKVPWLAKLKQDLSNIPAGANIFVEIPYGLLPEYHSYRYLGAKIVYLGCDSDDINQQRLKARGTPEHQIFIEKIPGRQESIEICRQQKLTILCLNTGNLPEDLNALAEKFNLQLQRGIT